LPTPYPEGLQDCRRGAGRCVTVGSLDGPPQRNRPEEAARTCRTFLSLTVLRLLLSLLANLDSHERIRSQYYHCLRTRMIRVRRGAAPFWRWNFSVEAMPSDVRPSFKGNGSCHRSHEKAAPPGCQLPFQPIIASLRRRAGTAAITGAWKVLRRLRYCDDGASSFFGLCTPVRVKAVSGLLQGSKRYVVKDRILSLHGAGAG